MFRSRGSCLVGLAVLALFPWPLEAQQGPINPRIPPPPPPAEPAPAPVDKPAPPPTVAAPPAAQPTTPPAGAPTPAVAPKKIFPPLPRVVPAAVVLPAGMPIRVVLDTPMSTRISRNGQQVVFRTERAIPLEGSLELPPETAFMGTVVKVRRPGAFGKQGEIRVEVRHLQLSTGQTAPVEARLDSADPDYSRKGKSDTSRAANILSLVLWTAQGTVLGANIHGGSGAAVGAGAGVLVGLIILASHRGQDVYLEPGTPFSVILEQPVTLPGQAVLAAEENYRNEQQGGSSVATNAGPITPGGNAAPATAGGPAGSSSPSRTTIDDPSEPRLKRRPPATAPQP